MAITKIIKVKVNANAAINYVRNPDKTNERLFVSEQEQQNLREQQLQNEPETKELQGYQNEIDTYLGKKHEDI